MQTNLKNIDVIKNIWFNKIYRMVFILLLAFSFLSHFIIHKYIFEQFYKELMTYILNEAKQVGNHIAVHQGDSTKTVVLQIAMNRILKDFNIMKIKLFDTDGNITHSTKIDEIGTKNNHDYFHNIVKKGELYYKVVKSGSNSSENEKQLRDVAEIYIPIIENGIFVGASEIYYDITDKRASLDKLIEDTDKVFMFVIIFSQISILLMLYFASKNNLMKMINDKKTKEIEDLMNKQARSVAIADMIGNVAHHWRQPLSVITTTISGLKMVSELKGSVNNEDVLVANDIIVKTAQTLSNTIDIFKDFTNDENEKEDFNISKIIYESIELSKITYSNSDYTFEFHMDESLSVNAVESKLTRVITNILINSYESFDREKIKNKKIIISLQSINSLVYIKIADNAGGIEPSILDKLFDPYFTTKHKFQGTGLGLFICSRIIIDHFNGNITCKNIEISGEKGSEFLITFPL
jgi:signal transduction histidine kinase